MRGVVEIELFWEGIHLDHLALPRETGLYAAWAVELNEDEEVVAARLLWIGESASEHGVHGRVRGHERWPDWKAELEEHEVIAFTHATHDDFDDHDVRRSVECLLIGTYGPIVNVVCNDEGAHCLAVDVRVTHDGEMMFTFDGVDESDACE